MSEKSQMSVTNLLDGVLREQQSKSSLIDLYRDNIDAETIRGRVIGFSDRLVQMEKISDEGEYDGISFLKRKDITRIRHQGRELDYLENLSANLVSSRSDWTPALKEIWELALEVQDRFGHLVIHQEEIDPDICFIGRVVSFDSDHVLLEEFGTLSTQDKRRLLLCREEISRIDCDGKYEIGISVIANA